MVSCFLGLTDFGSVFASFCYAHVRALSSGKCNFQIHENTFAEIPESSFHKGARTVPSDIVIF